MTGAPTEMSTPDAGGIVNESRPGEPSPAITDTGLK
jgi:hypothetical protein